ncbi:hypothetical protein Ga0080574_TMP2925 [Salipiger abyssi]|uniref:Uncharacterized protein n=1 Tax=Salipiger abyssi TaxID=1250539 RepID=A0A1P8UV49_9RHOB|nr:hypothetical protein Ga0080574_TMP2925 [Salipiger abyssi]
MHGERDTGFGDPAKAAKRRPTAVVPAPAIPLDPRRAAA